MVHNPAANTVGIATHQINNRPLYSEKTGPCIEWQDDVDLNYLDSTTEQWERYFKEE